MSEAQRAAFKAGTGGLELTDSYSLWVGLVLTLLILWMVWTLITTYQGWAAGKVSTKAMGGAVVRLCLLLLITMFFMLS